MDLDVERIAFDSVVGVTGAAVAAGTGRERNQQVKLGKKFDEIAGPNRACFHEVLMRVARVASVLSTPGALSRRDNAATGPNSASPSPRPRRDSYGPERRDA